jgi:hypothetical protein
MVTQITIMAASLNEPSRTAASHDACEADHATQTDDYVTDAASSVETGRLAKRSCFQLDTPRTVNDRV